MQEHLGVFAVEDYLKLERNPQQWIIQDIIPTNGLVNLYSSPKAGKTMLTMHMALAIANPDIRSVLGLPVSLHGRVLYLELDTPRNQWAMRLERATLACKAPPNTLFTADRLTCPKNFNITNSEHAQWLREWVTLIKPIVVFIDTLREIHDSDEDNSTAVKKVVSSILDAIPDTAIVFLSHSRKTMQNMQEEMGNIIEDARGSSYISGKMDSIIRITSKLFAFQTRSGKGEFTITQNKATGELRRLFSEKSFKDYIRFLMDRNPEMSMDQHVAIILETIDLSREAVVAKYNEVLHEPKQQEDSEDLKRALKALQKLENPDEIPLDTRRT